MSKRSTRGEGKPLAVFNAFVDVEELLKVPAKKCRYFHVGRVVRAVNDAAEALAGKPHVGAVERPEIDGRLIGAHFVLAKEKPRRFSASRLYEVGAPSE